MILKAVLTSRIARRDASTVGITKEDESLTYAYFEKVSLLLSLQSVSFVGDCSIRHPEAVTTAPVPKSAGRRLWDKIREAALDIDIIIESKQTKK